MSSMDDVGVEGPEEETNEGGPEPRGQAGHDVEGDTGGNVLLPELPPTPTAVPLPFIPEPLPPDELTAACDDIRIVRYVLEVTYRERQTRDRSARQVKSRPLPEMSSVEGICELSTILNRLLQLS